MPQLHSSNEEEPRLRARVSPLALNTKVDQTDLPTVDAILDRYIQAIGGPVERLFFDVQTGLLTRRSWETPTYFGPLPSAIDYDDYRKVGSVRLPFIIRRSRAGTTFLQTISELKLNVPIDESIFKKPPKQK